MENMEVMLFLCLAVLMILPILQVLQIFRRHTGLTQRDKKEIIEQIESVRREAAGQQQAVKDDMAAQQAQARGYLPIGAGIHAGLRRCDYRKYEIFGGSSGTENRRDRKNAEFPAGGKQ